MGCCQTMQFVKISTTTSFNTNATACAEGLLEPACRLGFHGMKNYSCPYSLNNTLAVAIMNSNTHSHVHKHGEYANYSPCHTFFPHRYALGLRNANLDDMIRFQSKTGYHNYVSFSKLTKYKHIFLFFLLLFKVGFTCLHPTILPSCHSATEVNAYVFDS